MSEINKGKFWSSVGKISVLLTVIWILVQMFSHFLKSNEIDIKVTGKHYPYKIANIHMEQLKNYQSVIALDKAYEKNVDKNGTSITRLLKYAESKEGKKNWDFQADIDRYLDFDPLVKIEKFNEIWSFKIENLGTVPIEDLLLEIPYGGFFKINTQKGNKKKGDFKNRIPLGELSPGYSINIICWIENRYYSISEYDEEKTRITHKYGWEEIDYEFKAQGFDAWVANYATEIFLFGPIIFIGLIFMAYSLGVEHGPELKRKEKLKKLDELKELEHLNSQESNNGDNEVNSKSENNIKVDKK